MLSEWRPDVDIAMPGETGLALVRELGTAASPHHAVRAVALTAFARPEERTAIVAAGFDAHVTKPIDPDALVAVLADVTTRAARDRASPAPNGRGA